MKLVTLVAALALVPAVALAQGSNTASRNEANAPAGVNPMTMSPQANASAASAGTPARDGCVNVPGEAHNSADCSKVGPADANTAMNRANSAGSNPASGATENAARNDRVLSGQSRN
jgi:hypothetical protein